MKPRLLIVEDEEAIRKGLCDVFIYNGYEVEDVSNGEEGLNKALTGLYHLVILDVMLPGMDGLSVCNEIRKKDRSQPILMLTAKGDEQDVINGLKQGADDYVTKPFSVRELVARVEAVLRRSQKLLSENEMIQWGGLEIDPRNLTLKIHKQPDNKRQRRVEGEALTALPAEGATQAPIIDLTRREVDLLRYFIQYADRPISRKELLKEVWGYGNTNMDTRTVDIHMTKLRRKIEKDPENPTCLMTVRGEGYKILPIS